MKMKFFDLVILISILYVYTLATPYSVRETQKVERTNGIRSRHIRDVNKEEPAVNTTNFHSSTHGQVVEEGLRTEDWFNSSPNPPSNFSQSRHVRPLNLKRQRQESSPNRGHTSTESTPNPVPDPCNISDSENTDSMRSRRAIEYSFNDLITTESPTQAPINISILSPEFLNCTHIYVEPECYERLHNGSVYVQMYSKMFDISNYVINMELLFICPNFFNDFIDSEKFSDDIRIVSFVCASISSACIILHIIMFIIVKSLRNLPGYCLLSLCVALLSAYLCTFLQSYVNDYTGCAAIGMFLLYFFLSAFFWMNIMAYDVWKSVRMATAKLRSTTGRPIMIQYARYSLYGWGTPLFIVFSSIIIHYSSSETSKYRLTFNLSDCWFKYKQALTLYFAGPLFTLIGMNIIFFASSFYMISNAAMSKSKSGSQGSSDLWSRFLLSLRLASVMGFMWIFGIIAAITKQIWLFYLYSFCSALQGVFIFCSFTVSERARKAFMKIFRKQDTSLVPSQQTSSQQMTSMH